MYGIQRTEEQLAATRRDSYVAIGDLLVSCVAIPRVELAPVGALAGVCHGARLVVVGASRRRSVNDEGACTQTHAENVATAHRKNESRRAIAGPRRRAAIRGVGRQVVCTDHVCGAVAERENHRAIVVKLNIGEHRSGTNHEVGGACGTGIAPRVPRRVQRVIPDVPLVDRG